MANEEQYYNPIIGAYLKAKGMQQETQQNAARLKLEQQKQDAEEAARSEAMRQGNEKIKNEHEFQTAQLGLLTKAHELAQLKSRQDAGAWLQSMAEHGAHPEVAAQLLGGTMVPGSGNTPTPSMTDENTGTQIPTGGVPAPPTQVRLPGLDNPVDLSGLAGPQFQIEQAGRHAEAVSKGTEAGKLPATLEELHAKHLNDLDLHAQEHQQKLEQIAAEGGNQARLAGIHGEYSKSVQNIEGGYRLRGIQLMHSLGLDDGSGSNTAIGANLLDGVLSGKTPWSSLSKDSQRVVQTLATAEGTQIPTDKAYPKSVDTIASMQTLMDQFRSLANNYSRDTSGGNVAAKLTHGLMEGTVPGGDLDSKLKEMKSMGGQLASYFDQQNRKSDAEILRQVIGSFDPRATKAQNLDKLEGHIQQLQQTVRNTFTGINPDRVNKILGDRGVGDFGAFKPRKTAIQLDDGSVVDDTPENRTKYGVK